MSFRRKFRHESAKKEAAMVKGSIVAIVTPFKEGEG